MQKKVKSFLRKLLNFDFIVLTLILVLALFLRVYRIGGLLGFYYDQGRDALVIWDLIQKGKFFLIGPTTGIEGVFRGPFYYYLIAPLYFIGKGNPIYPSVFLSFTSVFSVYLIYYLGNKFQGKETGIFAALIATFSWGVVMASRWLSNPTPMFILSMILIWGVYKLTEGKKWAWPIIAFTLGLSLFHFGSAAEVFYFPAILAVTVWFILKPGGVKKYLPDKKNLIASIILFAITFLPLYLFDFRHGQILSENIKKFLITDKSFSLPAWRFIEDKLSFFWGVFERKLFHNIVSSERIVLGFFGLIFVYFFSKLIKNDYLKILLIFLLSSLLGIIFFQGNFGNVYDYYFTGYYLIFILLFSVFLGFLWKEKLIGKILVIIFFLLFFSNNLKYLSEDLSNKGTSDTSFYLMNQKDAIDWIYQNASNNQFNLDVYVPPVIPYSYDYLFKWYGGGRYGYEPKKENIKLLYTLYEQDPPSPDRLEAWLKRQKGIANIIQEKSFGGITVQRRERIK